MRGDRSFRGSRYLVEGTCPMLRRSFVFGALFAITLVAANGCQSCSSCHDYDPPVAHCNCGGCSTCGCNSGCSSCGCSSCGCGGGCSSCGCNSGCSSCGCGGGGGCSSCNGGPVMESADSNEGVPMQGQVMMPQSNGQYAQRPMNSR
jgi:hypothetical protein